MDDYKKVYHKLFNSITDLHTDTKELLARMEEAQQQREDIVIGFDEEETKKAGEAS